MAALGSKVIEDVAMNCEPGLHRALELHRHEDLVEIDLTHSCRPWPRIIAAHDMCDEIVGPGVVRFLVAAGELRCPFRGKECPLVHFIVQRVDGSRVTFSSLRRTHSDIQNNISEKDRVLAFRLDRSIAFIVLASDGAALRWLSPPLRADRALVRKALRNNCKAMEWAAPELQADKSLVLEVFRPGYHRFLAQVGFEHVS